MSGNTFAVPAHALSAWEAMHRQILATGPTPCAGAGRDRWTGPPRRACPVPSSRRARPTPTPQTFGVWGGYTARERQIRRGGAR